MTPPTSLKTSKKWGSSGGGGSGGVRTKNSLGNVFFGGEIMTLQGVKLTIQPLEVGYANRPKKAQNGGVSGVFPYIRLLGFDLTTSARRFATQNAATKAYLLSPAAFGEGLATEGTGGFGKSEFECFGKSECDCAGDCGEREFPGDVH